jgi:hypothetical protein
LDRSGKKGDGSALNDTSRVVSGGHQIKVKARACDLPRQASSNISNRQSSASKLNGVSVFGFREFFSPEVHKHLLALPIDRIYRIYRI